MKRTVVALVVVLALGMSPWLIGTAYMNIAGITIEGTVIQKREAIELPGGDAWAHVFEITYQYQPLDSAYPETESHRVDPSLYGRLQVGSTVRVRYSPWRPLRFVKGWGSFLADSSSFSRIRYQSGSSSATTELAGYVVAVLMGLVAYRRKSRSLALVAALVGATSVPSVLLAGFALLVFPLLFRAWRANPGEGYGWLLLGSMALTPAILYWRIPQPTPMPPSPRREATAIVRRVKVADQIWTIAGYYVAGEGIRQPFQMLDLEFTPDGAKESIHVLDRIDLNSVPGLREGATVPIYYSSADPGLARVAGGTRNYPRQAWVYLLELTYGIGAAFAFLVFPALELGARLFRSFVHRAMTVREEAIRQISRLPENDPRRKLIEQAIRAKARGQSQGSSTP